MTRSRDHETPRDDGSSAARHPNRDDGAGRLFRAARAYDPAVTVTFAEIQAAARARRYAPAHISLRVAVVGALVVLLVSTLGSVALSHGWLAGRKTAEDTLVVVPAGASVRVERRGHFRLSLRGPAAAEIAGGGQAIRLDQGQAQIVNEERALVVEAGGRRVDVPPRATVAIEPAKTGTWRLTSPDGSGPQADASSETRSTPTVPRPLVAIGPPGTDRNSENGAESNVALRAGPPPAPASSSRERLVVGDVKRRSGSGVFPADSTHPGPEVAILRDALERLRGGGDTAAALRLLDEHDRRFPNGLLHDEVAIVRVEALLAAGRPAEALSRIDAIPSSQVERSARLRIARAELRAANDRCAEADTDFAALLSAPVSPDIEVRATRGRAACHGNTGATEPHAR